MIQPFETAVHVAYFDALRGMGMLVRPDPRDDTWLPPVRWGDIDPEAEASRRGDLLLAGSLHESDWDAMIRELSRHGIEPMDEFDALLYEGRTQDGRDVVSLYGPSIQSQVSLEDLSEAHRRLSELVGLISA